MNPTDILVLVKRSAKPYYVYVLAKPNGAPFYVGIGTGRRVLDHAMFARRPRLDSHKLRVIRKIWRDGGEIDYSIWGWFDIRSDAEICEAALILSIGRRDLRTGTLTNVTAGGEGAPSPSDQVTSRRSLNLRMTWAARDKTAAMAHLHRPEVYAKGAASRLGKKRGPYKWVKRPGINTPELRLATSLRLKSAPISKRSDVREKISATLSGRQYPDHWTRSVRGKRRLARGNHPRAKAVEIDGRRFACIMDAAEVYWVSRDTIVRWMVNPAKPRGRWPVTI